MIASLEGFLGLMWESADLLAESVEMQRAEGKHMDIHAMVQAMTVQVVGTTAFGCTLFRLRTNVSAPCSCPSGKLTPAGHGHIRKRLRSRNLSK